MKNLFYLISLVILGSGLYLQYFYDVPDVQANVNFFTAWFLIIIGSAGFLSSLFWSTPRN